MDETMETSQQETQQSNATNSGVSIPEANEPDLSAYFKDGEAGVFDPDKVAGLARDLENQKKSTSYFQSQFMKKNGVPEKYEDYFTNFKPDSTYESVFDDENLKEVENDIFKWCHVNKIGSRESQLFMDYILKNAVASNIIDTRSEEEIEAERQLFVEEEVEKVQPMLDSLGRTLEENNQVIENFLNSRSVFTNSQEMKNYIQELADTDARGYKLVTLMTQAFEHSGVPVVTGDSVGSKDKVALTKEYNNEPDPVKREALMRAYYGE